MEEWEELMAKNTKEIVIKNMKFKIKELNSFELDKIRSKTTSINTRTQDISFDAAEFNKKILEEAITEYPKGKDKSMTKEDIPSLKKEFRDKILEEALGTLSEEQKKNS